MKAKKSSKTSNKNRPIKTKVAEFSNASSNLPNNVASIFKAEQDSLDKSGLPPKVMPIGMLFPDAELIDAEGAPTSLKQVINGETAVIIFYRGAWCPYCNIALGTYKQVLSPKLKQRGVKLIAISPQKPDGSMTMKQKHNLDFPVLSDPGNKIAKKLGILTATAPEALAAQKKLGLD